MTWTILLRRLGYSWIPEFLGTFLWSFWARNLNPSWGHNVNCITEVWSIHFRPVITMQITCIVESYTHHDTLVWTNLVIISTKIITSDFVWITIEYQYPWRQYTQSLVATTSFYAENSEHIFYVFSHLLDQILPCQNSEVVH